MRLCACLSVLTACACLAKLPPSHFAASSSARQALPGASFQSLQLVAVIVSLTELLASLTLLTQRARGIGAVILAGLAGGGMAFHLLNLEQDVRMEATGIGAWFTTNSYQASVFGVVYCAALWAGAWFVLRTLHQGSQPELELTDVVT